MNINQMVTKSLLEMVNDKKVRDELTERSKQDDDIRKELPAPETDSINDAFYTVIICSFQNDPIVGFSLVITLILSIGYLISELFLYLIGLVH